MNQVICDAIAAIEAQQPKKRSAVWMVGEQLKDMCRRDAAAAVLLPWVQAKRRDAARDERAGKEERNIA